MKRVGPRYQPPLEPLAVRSQPLTPEQRWRRVMRALWLPIAAVIGSTAILVLAHYLAGSVQ